MPIFKIMEDPSVQVLDIRITNNKRGFGASKFYFHIAIGIYNNSKESEPSTSTSRFL